MGCGQGERCQRQVLTAVVQPGRSDKQSRSIVGCVGEVEKVPHPWLGQGNKKSSWAALYFKQVERTSGQRLVSELASLGFES